VPINSQVEDRSRLEESFLHSSLLPSAVGGERKAYKRIGDLGTLISSTHCRLCQVVAIIVRVRVSTSAVSHRICQRSPTHQVLSLTAPCYISVIDRPHKPIAVLSLSTAVMCDHVEQRYAESTVVFYDWVTKMWTMTSTGWRSDL